MMYSVDLLRKGLGAISVIGGVAKIAAPGATVQMWPRLPSWFWASAGIWEIIAGYLLFTGEEYLDAALGLLFIFMGGVLSSVVYIKDENGNTHFSGKGKMGSAGKFMVIPGLLCSAMYVYVSIESERSEMSQLLMVAYGLSGFLWGVCCSGVGECMSTFKKE